MSEEKLLNVKEIDSFSWLDYLPVGVAVFDQEEYSIIAYNHDFRIMFGKDTKEERINDLYLQRGLEKEEMPSSILLTIVAKDKTYTKSAIVNELLYKGEKVWLCVFKYVFDTSLALEDTFDTETGLYSRSAGFNLLTRHMEEARYMGSVFTYAYIKVSEEGKEDELLSDEKMDTILHVINDAIRGTDIFSRIGNAEFLLIFPKCPHHIVDNILVTLVNRFILIAADNPDMAEGLVFTHGVVEFTALDQMIAPLDAIDRAMKKSSIDIISI